MKRTRHAVLILLGLLAMSAAFCLASYAWGALRHVARQRQQARIEQVRSEQSRREELKRQQQQWLRVEGVYRDFCARHFMRRDSISDLRRQLNDLLEANLLPNRSLTFDTTQGSGGFQRVLVHFTVSGGYGNVKKLIHDIAALRSMAFLSQVDFAANGPQVNARLQMEVFLE